MKKPVPNSRRGKTATPSEILVITNDAQTRGWGPKALKVSELTAQMNVFISQIGEMVGKTQATVGSFRFEEFEIQAEITAKGSLALLGTGGEAGLTGGIKFVFRRAAS
jgi:hypothetical protein